MVFAKVLYYPRSLLCRASSVAAHLVAPTNDAAMEDRTHNRNPCPELDLVPNDDGIHPNSQGVLQANSRIVK